jgi:hypothetical protein
MRLISASPSASAALLVWLADIGGADEARDGPVPATAADECNFASTIVADGVSPLFDIEAKSGASNYCGR